MRLTPSRTRSLGVALSEDRLIARIPARSQPDAGECWMHSLAPLPENDQWSELTTALTELRTLVAEDCATLHVALMPPLGHVRLIALSGVSEEEATRVVNRDPSRFFPVRGERLSVELEGRGWRRLSPFVAAAAPRRVIDAVARAAAEAGWSLGGIVPAPLSWAALADGQWPREIVVCLGGHVELLRVADGNLIGTRRLSAPPAEPNVELADERIVIPSAIEAAARAAELAARSLGPALQSDAQRAAVRRANRRRGIVRLTIAAAILIAAALLELAGIDRDRERIVAERQRIHRVVAQSVATRESIAVATERLTSARAIGMAAPRWSSVIATLADELPTDAYLVSLSAEGDSLHLEGAAVRAARVFDAVNTIASVRGVRADGPIRQEIRGNSATEHFVLSAFVARAEGVASSEAAPNGAAAGGKHD